MIAYTDGTRFEGYFKEGKRDGPGRWIVAGLAKGEKNVRELNYDLNIAKKNQTESLKCKDKHDIIFGSCLKSVRGQSKVNDIYSVLLKRIKIEKDMEAIVQHYEQFRLRDIASENSNVKFIRKYQTVEAQIRPEGTDYFINGAGYFGEWILNSKKEKWVPNGRGIVINFSK